MSSASTTTNEHSDKAPGGERRAPRQRIESLVYVDLGPFNGGFPINVSENGLAFQGVRPLQQDEFFPIKFKLPDLDNPMKASAQVVWVNGIGTGGGLRFVDLPKDCRLLIKNWIFAENRDANPDGDFNIGLEKLIEISSILAAVQQIQPASTATLPAAETNDGSTSVPEIADQAVQGSSPFAEVQTGENVNAAFALRPVRSTASASAFETSALLMESKVQRGWFTRTAFLRTAGIVCVAALIFLAIGQGALLEKIRGNITQLFGDSNPVTAVPSPFGSEIENHIADPAANSAGDQSGDNPATAKKELEPAHPASVSTPASRTGVSERQRANSHFMATGPIARTGSSKLSKRRLKAFSKALRPRPRAIVRPDATDVAPPTIEMQIRPQPTRLLSMGLPEPPSPAMGRAAPRTTDVEAARLLVHRDPIYPSVARISGSSGSVNLVLAIGVDGKVHSVRVVSGDHLLAQAAVDAVMSWRFQPARRDGTPIESESETVVNFKLH